MSFDLNLPTTCNHSVYKELALLDTDARSLRVVKPLAATVNVSVYACDNLVPKSSYAIIADPDQIEVNQDKMIYFKEKWASPSDYFQVSYTTHANYCSKCSGLNALNDISYDVRGGLKIVRDEYLLLQNVEKYTITESGSNPFHSFLGTSLITLIGTKITDSNYMNSKIVQEINATLSRLQDMQNQYRQSGRKVTKGEMLRSVTNISAIRDPADPTICRADVSVIAESGKTVEFQQYLKLS